MPLRRRASDECSFPSKARLELARAPLALRAPRRVARRRGRAAHPRRALDSAFTDQPQHEVSAWTREFIQRYCPWGIGTLQLETRVGRIGELVPLVAEQCECDLIALGWSQQLSLAAPRSSTRRSSARSCQFSSFRSSSLRTRSLSSCSRRRRRPDASAARLPRPQRETLRRKRLRSPLTRPPRSPEADQVSSEFDVGGQAARRENPEREHLRLETQISAIDPNGCSRSSITTSSPRWPQASRQGSAPSSSVPPA